MRKKYYIDKRVFKNQKTNPFLSQAEVYDLLDLVSQLVAGSVPGQPVIPYIFGNGVLQQGNNVGLGGSMNQDTIIDGNQHVLSLFDLSQFNVTAFDIDITTLSGDLILNSFNDVLITSSNDTRMEGANYSEMFTGNYTSDVQGDQTLNIGGLRQTYVTGNDENFITGTYYLEAQVIDTYGDFRNSFDPWYLRNGSLDITIIGAPINGNGHYFESFPNSSGMVLVEDFPQAVPIIYNVDDTNNTIVSSEYRSNNYTTSLEDWANGRRSNFSLSNGRASMSGGDILGTETYMVIDENGLTITDNIINQRYTIPNFDGLNGQVLITDGAGNVSWGSSPSSLSANNGLTLTGTNVQWGGPLVQDVFIQGPYGIEIDVAGNEIIMSGDNISFNSFVDSISLNSADAVSISSATHTSITTDDLRFIIPSDFATLASRDVLECVNPATGEFSYKRQTKTIELQIIGLNDTIIGLGQSTVFLRIPDHLQGWRLKEIEASTHTQGGALDLGIEVSLTNHVVTINNTQDYGTSLVNTLVSAGDLVKMSLINPSGAARTGLSIILVFKNA